MVKTTISDAFQQKKGDLYHYAEVVEICLKANEDEIVYIENYGDISTKTTSIEVKDLESSITLGSHQIWNTLKNWIQDLEQFEQFDRLLLISTSPVVTDKNIPRWNDLTRERKLEVLIEAANKIKRGQRPSKEKLKLFKKVLNFDDLYSKSDLLSILDKFKICLKDVNSEKRYEELYELEQLKFFTKPQKKTIINEVIGIIFKRGIEGKDNWVINISELNRTIVQFGSGLKKKLPKLLKAYDNLKIEDYQNDTFVTEMDRINLDAWEIERAIGDYCKTQDSIIQLLAENMNYADDIKRYKNGDLYNYLVRSKKVTALMCNGNNNIPKSQENYYNCLTKITLLPLELIKNEHFFQRGNIHSIVDEKNYHWLIDEN